jgi:peptide-methionine (S)-S-oxide reductase
VGPCARRLRGPPAHLLGGARPDPGDAAGERRRTQYRSALYVHSEAQRRAAGASRDAYAAALRARGLGEITTEIRDAPPFYYAEEYHQQYLAKDPDGYCGLGGTGVSCPVGTGVEAGAGHHAP